ncbi:hypothetical protein AJ79_09161 [Helicocarpus griseus UAMH5409]|uniref:RRM domain-containing protein n=1 Tax=Helicocarpus griseus UAMH5409 TaxID=1447875 RepID=A0A2B7WLR9_9EURO|nr:hypothetical protein AJ79_09161 [Helicocarpus griseus UAMH5409]
MTGANTTRLHISPLTPELLQSILPPSAREAATDISFHEVQTFPENSYGFVNLPKMEAEKITKKLNGSILKGKKLKIQEARPSKRPLPDNGTPSESTESKPEKASKKRKSTDNVVDGYELPPERHVKRGWTEPASQNKRSRKSDKKEEKRKSQRSKYTEKSECLFRASVPPNRADSVTEKKKYSEKEKKKKNKKDGDVVVHEFENSTTIPSFLRTGENPPEEALASEFVEGKGWVDRVGKIKEPPPPEKPATTEKAKAKQALKDSQKAKEDKGSSEGVTEKGVAHPSATKELDSDETSSSGSSLDSSSDDDLASSTSGSSSDGEDDSASSSASDGDKDTEKPKKSKTEKHTPQTSTANDSSTSSSDEDDKNSKNPKPQDRTAKPTASTTTIEPSSVATPKQTTTANQTTTLESPSTIEIHPLEALFKRRDSNTSKPPLEIKTQFSFFGAGDDDIEEEDEPLTGHVHNNTEPLTPFTKQDYQSRVVRSAAPTPDTALPRKTKFWENDRNGEDDRMDVDENDDYHYGDEDEDEDGGWGMSTTTPSKRAASAGDGKSKKEVKEGVTGESDFAKWFWENRGDNNRAWKRRRREAAKEKRQRENRSKGIRGK